MKNNIVYIEHIYKSIIRVEKFINNVSKNAFYNNELIQSAVIREIEVVGEATKNLSSDFRKIYSEVRWKDIAGMRDKLIHDYMGVDLNYVWFTVTEDFNVLKEQVENILTDYK